MLMFPRRRGLGMQNSTPRLTRQKPRGTHVPWFCLKHSPCRGYGGEPLVFSRARGGADREAGNVGVGIHPLPGLHLAAETTLSHLVGGTHWYV